MFGTIMGALIVAHYLADFYVQTDHQAQHKGLRGDRVNEGRWNCLKHAASYTAVQAIVLPAVMVIDGIDVNYPLTLLALVLNGVTHYVIDRRWTLEAFARGMGKSGWIDADKTAMMHLDQAAHLVLLGLFAAFITIVH
jgi:hypothetical protein